MRVLYSFAILIYSFFINAAALAGNKKAVLWVLGRKNWKENLVSLNQDKKKITWFHVASLGEFEQARPLIEEIKREDPKEFILVSFFSPSGYEIRKDYKLADKVIYLPVDTPKNAKTFLNIVQPHRIIFVKYEFWFNYLSQIRLQNIECYLICGIFRKNQHFFKPYGGWFKKHLAAFNHFFVQNDESLKLLKSIGFKNASKTGDTRLDRVLSISKESFSEKRFESFSKDSSVLIIGSSWERENELAIKFSNSDIATKIIIAPHEIDAPKFKSLQGRFTSSCKLLSETTPDEDLHLLKVLIIDRIGLLSKLYRYGNIAFIGGGFGLGIHNTLEAVIYGCPVLFGPNYKKFQEAYDLLEIGAGFCVRNQEEFYATIRFLNDESNYQNAITKAKSYVNDKAGATPKILDYLYEK
ncbi:3-deoxy-D-manno-octulosonic acid transferase [Vicingaceae bacterium]|nr:3-deoxy-D-manno-octulosonic acid transferase [Vicingaceae bacterium]